MPVQRDATTDRPEANGTGTTRPPQAQDAGDGRSASGDDDAAASEQDGGDAAERDDVDAEELPGVDDDPAAAELSLDVAFDLLKNQRRRRVLRHLEAADGQLRLGDLAEEIAAQENDTTVQALTSAERKRVYVGLYQVHLPKLDDAGVVEFDQARGTVEEAERAETLLEYLDRGDEPPERPWYKYYGGLTAGSAGLYAGGVAGILPTTLVLGVVITLFLGCSGAHSVAVRSRD